VYLCIIEGVWTGGKSSGLQRRGASGKKVERGEAMSRKGEGCAFLEWTQQRKKKKKKTFKVKTGGRGGSPHQKLSRGRRSGRQEGGGWGGVF